MSLLKLLRKTRDDVKQLVRPSGLAYSVITKRKEARGLRLPMPHAATGTLLIDDWRPPPVPYRRPFLLASVVSKGRTAEYLLKNKGTMVMRIPLKECFAEGRTAFGTWNTIPVAGVVRTVASTPGLSWVAVDAEHGRINDTQLYTHATTISAASRSPIVRIPDASAWWAKRALDAGAHGMMVPLIRNAKEVEEVVRFCKYPPRGIRGFGPMYTHHAFGSDCTSEEYKAGASDLFVIVQIETQEAVANLEEIAQVPGLDILFIGPYDLALNLGVSFGSSDHEDAIQKVLTVSHKYGKKAAIYCSNGEQSRLRAEQGFDMISIAADVSALARTYAAYTSIATGQSASVES